MALSRRHYEHIAREIIAPRLDDDDASGAATFNEAYEAGVIGIAWDLAEYFATDNPNFDSARFLVACGVKV